MEFSANLGFLFADLPFPDRISAAVQAGFRAVEFHDQAQAPGQDLARIAALLDGAGLRLCSLNTHMGSTIGSAALPGEETRFRAEFDQALAVAQDLGAEGIHVMAGLTGDPAAMATYLNNLEYALGRTDRMLLLEPLSPQATPGYFLHSFEQFEAVVHALPDPKLRLMGDWYHAVQLCGGGALARLTGLADHLGHLQLARGEDRGDPFAEQVAAFPALRRLALERGLSIGLEYRATAPVATVLASLRQGRL